MRRWRPLEIISGAMLVSRKASAKSKRSSLSSLHQPAVDGVLDGAVGEAHPNRRRWSGDSRGCRRRRCGAPPTGGPRSRAGRRCADRRQERNCGTASPCRRSPSRPARTRSTSRVMTSTAFGACVPRSRPRRTRSMPIRPCAGERVAAEDGVIADGDAVLVEPVLEAPAPEGSRADHARRLGDLRDLDVRAAQPLRRGRASGAAAGPAAGIRRRAGRCSWRTARRRRAVAWPARPANHKRRAARDRWSLHSSSRAHSATVSARAPGDVDRPHEWFTT